MTVYQLSLSDTVTCTTTTLPVSLITQMNYNTRRDGVLSLNVYIALASELRHIRTIPTGPIVSNYLSRLISDKTSLFH